MHISRFFYLIVGEMFAHPTKAKMQLISGFVDSYLRLNSQEKTIFKSELNTMGLKEKEQMGADY